MKKQSELLSLDEIQLDSFVTTIDAQEAQNVEGGVTPVLISIATSSEPCAIVVGSIITATICAQEVREL